MIAATATVLRREGSTLSTYGMQSGPLGYLPLREFVADKLAKRSGMTVSADDVLITSGSNHGLELVNSILCAPGDVVLVEQFSYGSALGRLRKFGATPVGIPLDDDGMRMDLLEAKLGELKAEGVTPKYIYIIPTIQNPGGSILPEDRRRELLRLSEAYAVPILEDECYADLLWDGKRPPAIAADGWRQPGDPCRLILQDHRAGLAGWLCRGGLGGAVPHGCLQERWRHRRAGTDDAGRVLQHQIR